MPKGMAPDREAVTSAVKLREMIHQLEVGAANLRGQDLAVLELLKLRDHLADELVRFKGEGLDVRPEETRVETVDGILMRKTSAVGWELRSIGGLAGARKKENPPEEHWWWYLDLYQAEQQRKTIRKTAIIIVSAVALVLIANFVLDRFFGLSPTEKAARNYTNAGEQSLMQGDLDKAIADYEQAVVVMPSLGDAQVMLGVLYEQRGKAGDAEKAQAAFAAGKAAFPNQVDYLSTLARSYQDMNQLDKALEVAQQAVSIAPDASQVYLIRGGVYEAMGRLAEAVDDYNRSATLAQEHGEDTIYVLAKTRMGMLMQSGASFQPTGTPSP